MGLDFTNQKNGVRGEIIGLGKAGSDVWCPLLATICCIMALHTSNAQPFTPLHAYYANHHWWGTTMGHITSQLHAAIMAMGSTYGLMPSEVSSHTLRSSSTMAMLCSNVNTDRIHLISCWHFDEMFQNFHTQAFLATCNIAPSCSSKALLP